MTLNDFCGLLPLLILAGGVVCLLLVISFSSNFNLASSITVVVFAGAFASLFGSSGPVNEAAFLMTFDAYARFFMGLFLATSLVITFFARDYFAGREEHKQVFFVLLILATIGASVLAASRHFVSLFLGLELLNISLYTLIPYLRERRQSIEAGVKYLILAAASSAFLLFGMALIYAQSGTMGFNGFDLGLESNIDHPLLHNAAFGLFMVGIGFKLAVVPFHMWSPDVYEGASVPVSAYIATISKGAVIAVLVRFLYIVKIRQHHEVLLIFSVIAVFSMIAGNLLALRQNNIKRLLAYSSISHLGYILVAFIAGDTFATEAIALYVTVYIVTLLAAFGVVTIFSTGERDADRLDDLQGLFWRRPWIAATLTLALFSLAGIPMTAGFIGKYYLVVAGINASLWFLVFLLIGNSVLSLYYYLKVIAAMSSQAVKTGEPTLIQPNGAIGSKIMLALLTLLILWIGVYPAPVTRLIGVMVAGLR